MYEEEVLLSERSLKNLEEHPSGEGIVEVNIHTVWGRLTARTLGYILRAFGNRPHSDLIFSKLGIKEKDRYSA